MKLSIVILGVFIAVGLLGGAYILASSKTDNTEYEAKLKLAEDRINELGKKTAQLEIISSQLTQELESSKLIIQNNNERIAEMSQQLSKSRITGLDQPAVRPAPPAGKIGDSIPSQPSPMPDVIEAVKEEVKKELKEERLAKETEQFQQWYREMHKTESEKFKKQMEEEFSVFAQKIKLSSTQEYAVRDIAEDAFKKIMALLEDTMANRSKEEIDWAAYQKQMEEIYTEAEQQIVELVSEEQADAIRKFFEDPGKR